MSAFSDHVAAIVSVEISVGDLDGEGAGGDVETLVDCVGVLRCDGQFRIKVVNVIPVRCVGVIVCSVLPFPA